MVIAFIILVLLAVIVAGILLYARYQEAENRVLRQQLNEAVWQFELEQREARRIVLAEYSYWRSHEGDDDTARMISMGAMGAASNILAALEGHPAAWHEEPPRLESISKADIDALDMSLFDTKGIDVPVDLTDPAAFLNRLDASERERKPA